jgi:hypothetical protein
VEALDQIFLLEFDKYWGATGGAILKYTSSGKFSVLWVGVKDILSLLAFTKCSSHICNLKISFIRKLVKVAHAVLDI